MELQYIEPIVCEPGAFPHSEELPEGCTEVEFHEELMRGIDLTDDVYCVRKYPDGSDWPLHCYICKPHIHHNETVTEKFPLLIYCPGSAFHKQILQNSVSMLVDFAARGYVVMGFEYRYSDLAPFPAQAEDCKAAVRWMKQNAEKFNGDPDRVALWGDSSGGHTVLMAGITGDGFPDAEKEPAVSAAVKCIVDWYAPTDFKAMNLYPSAMEHRTAEGPEGVELGGVSPIEHPELSDAASPMTYIRSDRKLPPILIMHGSRDDLVPFNQSVRLYEKLRECGQEVRFYKLKNAGHGTGFQSDGPFKLVEDFLREKL